MSRDITAGFEAEIEADELRPALLVKLEFGSGDVLAWTGVGDLIYDSETYTGLGNFLTISPVQESQKLEANGLQFVLSGVNSSLVSLALTEDYQWRPISLFFAVLDADYSLIADPYQLFKGRMDIMEITDDGNESTIALNAENILIDLKESKERRLTPEDQIRYFPNDKGLNFVPTVQDIELAWGTS